MTCIYCKEEMRRTEKETPYGVRIGGKCPRCGFAFSAPIDRPEDTTIIFPDETKLKEGKA